MDYRESDRAADLTLTDSNLNGPNVNHESIDSMLLGDSISESRVQNAIGKDKCTKQEQVVNKGDTENWKQRHRKGLHEEPAIPVGFDAVLRELGSPGRYVFFQILLNLLGHYAMSSTVFIYAFIGYEPPHTCQVLTNESELLSQYELDNSTADIRYRECSISLVSNQTGQEQTVATLGCLNGHDYKGQRHISFISEVIIIQFEQFINPSLFTFTYPVVRPTMGAPQMTFNLLYPFHIFFMFMASPRLKFVHSEMLSSHYVTVTISSIGVFLLWSATFLGYSKV